ncbi:hypothetical protein FBY04_11045 [Pseudomonas sp. SJZ080]|nr:hypothetical protein FBY04_11045 [Pseudomonas sp. SJZ080]
MTPYLAFFLLAFGLVCTYASRVIARSNQV